MYMPGLCHIFSIYNIIQVCTWNIPSIYHQQGLEVGVHTWYSIQDIIHYLWQGDMVFLFPRISWSYPKLFFQTWTVHICALFMCLQLITMLLLKMVHYHCDLFSASTIKYRLESTIALLPLCQYSTQEILESVHLFDDLHSTHHPHHIYKFVWSSIFNAHHAVCYCPYKFLICLCMQDSAVVFFTWNVIADVLCYL